MLTGRTPLEILNSFAREYLFSWGEAKTSNEQAHCPLSGAAGDEDLSRHFTPEKKSSLNFSPCSGRPKTVRCP